MTCERCPFAPEGRSRDRHRVVGVGGAGRNVGCARGGCRGVRGKGLCEQQRRWHGVGNYDRHGCGVAPITVPSRPVGVAITPDGKHAYVANIIAGTVSVITTATGAVQPPSPSATAPMG